MIYDVDPVEDNLLTLRDILQIVAARQGHVRIVNVIWKPTPAPDELAGVPLVEGLAGGYVIISERED